MRRNIRHKRNDIKIENNKDRKLFNTISKDLNVMDNEINNNNIMKELNELSNKIRTDGKKKLINCLNKEKINYLIDNKVLNNDLLYEEISNTQTKL
jgi:hypothetical protein